MCRWAWAVPSNTAPRWGLSYSSPLTCAATLTHSAFSKATALSWLVSSALRPSLARLPGKGSFRTMKVLHGLFIYNQGCGFKSSECALMIQGVTWCVNCLSIFLFQWTVETVGARTVFIFNNSRTHTGWGLKSYLLNEWMLLMKMFEAK